MSIIYSRNTVALKPGAFAPNPDILARTFWLLCRNTSVTYIGRMTEMLKAFLPGFKAFVAKRTEPGAYLDALSGGCGCLNNLENGLTRIQKGDAAGLPLIWEGIRFQNLFYFGRFGSDMEYRPLGKRGDFREPNDPPSIGLWCWMENAVQMSMRVKSPSSGKLSYPLFDVNKYRFPKQIGGFPLSTGITVVSRDDVPRSGIWIPRKLKGGCPNYFLRGRKAPTARLAMTRIDEIETDSNIPGSSRIASSDFEPGEFPCTWELVWEDTRYRDGKIPLEEQEYLLDDYTQFPKDPPVAPGP